MGTSRINFVMGFELATKTGDTNPLTWFKKADINARLDIDEYLNHTGAVIDKELIAIGKITDRRLSDLANNPDNPSFGGFANPTGGNPLGMNRVAIAIEMDIGWVGRDEYEQSITILERTADKSPPAR